MKQKAVPQCVYVVLDASTGEPFVGDNAHRFQDAVLARKVAIILTHDTGMTCVAAQETEEAYVMLDDAQGG